MALLYLATRLVFLAKGDLEVARTIARDASATSLFVASLLTLVGPALIAAGYLVHQHLPVGRDVSLALGTAAIIAGVGLLPTIVAIGVALVAIGTLIPRISNLLSRIGRALGGRTTTGGAASSLAA